MTGYEKDVRLPGDGELQLDGKSYWMAAVEIKSKEAPTTRCSVLHLATERFLFRDLGDDISRNYIPRK